MTFTVHAHSPQPFCFGPSGDVSSCATLRPKCQPCAHTSHNLIVMTFEDRRE